MSTFKQFVFFALLGAALGAGLSACSSAGGYGYGTPDQASGRFEGYGGYNGGL